MMGGVIIVMLLFIGLIFVAMMLSRAGPIDSWGHRLNRPNPEVNPLVGPKENTNCPEPAIQSSRRAKKFSNRLETAC